jgi:hypothetical protein
VEESSSTRPADGRHDRAVRFKRAFRPLEDRCLRIACKIDPGLLNELD